MIYIVLYLWYYISKLSKTSPVLTPITHNRTCTTLEASPSEGHQQKRLLASVIQLEVDPAKSVYQSIL